jgi:hypothetical protein
MSARRTVAAFLIAPLVVPFAFLLPYGREVSSANETQGSYFLTILLYSIYAVPIAYFAELVLGIPAWMLFKRFHIRSLPVFAIAGALMGLLVHVSMFLQSRAFYQPPDSVRNFATLCSSPYLFVCVVAGCSSAILFWIVALSGRRSRVMNAGSAGHGPAPPTL